MLDYSITNKISEDGIPKFTMRSNKPINFRLAIDAEGVYTLQGEFIWSQGFKQGSDWVDLETVKKNVQ